MKLYIAARFSWQKEASLLRTQLASLGYEITSRWLDTQGEAITGLMNGTATMDQVKEFADHDLADIDDAPIFLLMTQLPSVPFRRGGRMTELGYAIARDKTIWILGPIENLFMVQRGVRFDSTLDLLDYATALTEGELL